MNISTVKNIRSNELEKTAPTTLTLPLIDIALLKAVAFNRGCATGGRASASAVLQDILKEYRVSLAKEADEYVFLKALFIIMMNK